MSNKDPFSDMQEVKTKSVKWGKVGDWFKGTLIDNTREIKNTLAPEKNEMQRILQFIAKGGSFHGIDENKQVIESPTEVNPGEIWTIFVKPGLWNQIRHAKLGQVVGFRFTEEKAPSKKGYNPTKLIKAFLGEMDPEYHGEQANDGMPPITE